jgi:hypothetical protein
MFERAPEPTDIFWENLGVSTISRVFSSLLSWFFTVLIIGVSFGIIAIIK